MEDMVVAEEGDAVTTDSQLHPHGYVVSAMRYQVKDPSEHEDVWKQPFKKKTHKKDVPGKLLRCSRPGTWGSSSSDDDLDPHGQSLTQKAMLAKEAKFNIATLCREGASLENLTNNTCSTKQEISPVQPWAPPKGFWRVTSPKTQLLNGDEVPVRNGLGSQTSGMDMHVKEEIQRSSCTESHIQSYSPSEELAVSTGSELWRAESLESVCSSGSSLSLAERVEMNRASLRQMLQKAHKTSNDGQDTPITNPTLENTHNRGGLNDSNWDSGISLPDCEQNQRSFVSGAELLLSPRHEQAKRVPERARMKARSNPLKADHTILPVQRDRPELLTWVGAPVQRASLVGTDRVVLGSGNLSDSFSSESTGGHRRRHTHGQSPTRVRFQDESEKEAEVRYLERQHRRAGERAQGLLGTKPCLASYINGQSSEDSESWKQKIRRSQQSLASANGHFEADAVGRQCNSCGTVLNGSLSDAFKQSANGEDGVRTVPCWVAPTLPNRLVRIEQIKETYIGAMSPDIVESDGTNCRASDGTDNGRGTLQRKKMNRRREGSPEADNNAQNGQLNPGSPSTTEMPLSNGATALPLNPYAPNLVAGRSSQSPANIKQAPSVSVPPWPVSPPLQSRQPTLNEVLKEHPNGKQGVALMPSQYHLTHIDPEDQNGKQSNTPQGNPPSPGPVLNSKVSALKYPTISNHLNHKSLRCGSQPAGLEQDQIRVEIPANPAENSREHLNNEEQVSVSTEPQRDDSTSSSDTTAPEVKQKEGRAHKAFNRLFSAMGFKSERRLGKSRTSSMELLGPTLKPGTHPIDTSEPSHTLKKTPSLQSLRLGSPFVQLKKSSSMQSLHAGRKKPERSNAYTPGERPCSPALSRGLQRALSVEDVGTPSALRSVGRVAQAFPDGTLLLELYRPPDTSFGFLISRGKGRLDTGVYVEEIGDSSTRKLYTGLLGVGDEILEVNGEKVAGLSLDLVTQLMTQHSTASIRVLRQRTPHR